MSNSEIKEFKVKKLPKNLQPSSLYYVKVEPNKFKIYLTDSKCPPTAYSLDNGTVKIATSPDGSIQVVETVTETQIQIEASLLAKINLALQAGDNISELVNDSGYLVTETDPIFQASEASLFISGDKANLDNQSGVNTGDQISIVGIIGTKSQYDISLTDGNFLFSGDITQYTDEQAQDSIGTILLGTSTIDLSYNDATPSISADIKSNSIDATHLSNTINISEFINDSNYLISSDFKTLEGQSIIGSGNIDLNKVDVGLGSVDNTSDLSKPISTATQTALDAVKNPVLTIASSTASDAVKKMAQFVCDGTNDDVEINAAIQSLPAWGGKIQLTNGLFNINSTIVIDRAVTFSGEGTGIAGRSVGNMYGTQLGITTLRASADVDVIRVDSAFKIKGIKFSDFILQGFGKDVSDKIGMYIKTDTDVMQIMGVNVLDCGIGIFGRNLDASNIINSSFQYNALGGLITDSYHVNLTNCVFADNNGKATVTVNSVTYNVQTGGLAIGGSNSNISGSVFVRNDIGGTPYNSLSVLAAISLKIDNCVFNEEQGNAIGIIGTDSGYAESTQISNNTITAFGKALLVNNRNGIYILKGHANHIFGNYIGSGLTLTTGEYAVVEDRAVNTFTGVTIVKNNIFRDIQNSAKVVLTGSQSNYTKNINVGGADTDNLAFVGVQSTTNTGSALNNGIDLTQSGTNSEGVLRITNTTTGVGELVINQSTGIGDRVNNSGSGIGRLTANSGTGVGSRVNNSSSGLGIYNENQSTGVLTTINSTPSSTGDLLKFNKDGANQWRVDSNSNVFWTVAPQTSTGAFDFLIRSIATGQQERISGTTFAPVSNPTFTTGITTPAINLSGQTASTIALFDASKNIVSASTGTYPNPTEFSYVKGVTSAIQTQLNGKQATLTNPITGTGTVNFLPKFTGTTNLGNSIFSDDGTNATISGDLFFGNGKGFIINNAGTNRGIKLYGDSTIDNFATFTCYPSSGTNVSSSMTIIPKGSGYGSTPIRAQVVVMNTDLIADPNNYDYGTIRAEGTYVTVATGKLGTGTAKPLLLSAGFGDHIANPNQLWLLTNGNILINTSTDNGIDKLQVTGTVSGTVDATISNQLVRFGQVPKFYTDSTTVALSSATLTSNYPNATIGSEVHALNITLGGIIYKKTVTGWASIMAVVTP